MAMLVNGYLRTITTQRKASLFLPKLIILNAVIVVRVAANIALMDSIKKPGSSESNFLGA